MTELGKKDLEYLREVAESSYKGIKESGCQCVLFLAIGSNDYHKNPVPLIQFAIAMFLDKPIGFLSIKGAKIPENIKKIAYIEECDDNKKSVEAATKRLLKRMEMIDGR